MKPADVQHAIATQPERFLHAIREAKTERAE